MILQTTGQDVKNIIESANTFFNGQKVDAIVYMLSLSFFFENMESILSIITLSINCVKQGGFFASLTIDGEKVISYFNSAQNITFTQDIDFNYYIAPFTQVDFRFITNKTSQQNLIYIDIPDSIVSKQLEYPPLLLELISYFTSNNYQLIEYSDVNTEIFLNSEEIIFNTLYSSLILSQKN